MNNNPNIHHERYSENLLELIYLKAKQFQQQNIPIEIEVTVNDKPLIPKTNNLESLLSLRGLVNDKTKYLNIYFYQQGQSVFTEKYYLHIKESKFTRSNQLEGFFNGQENSDSSNENTKEKLLKEIHYDQLIEENEFLKNQIKRYEEKILQLDTEKTELLQNKTKGIENLAGVIFTGIVNSPFVKEKLPLFNDLAGFAGFKSETKSQAQPTENSNVNYSSNEAPQQEEQEFDGVVVSSELEPYIEILDKLPVRLGEVHLPEFMHMVDIISQNPPSIKHVLRYHYEYLKRATNKKKNESL